MSVSMEFSSSFYSESILSAGECGENISAMIFCIFFRYYMPWYKYVRPSERVRKDEMTFDRVLNYFHERKG